MDGGGLIKAPGVLVLNGETKRLIELHRTAAMVPTRPCLPLPKDDGKPAESGMDREAGQHRPSRLYTRLATGAQVAQLVEQWTENPRVGGSNPPLGTILSPRH